SRTVLRRVRARRGRRRRRRNAGDREKAGRTTRVSTHRPPPAGVMVRGNACDPSAHPNCASAPMPRPFGRFVASPAAAPRAGAGLWPTRPRAADPSRPVSSSGNGPRFLYPAWLMALEIQLRTIGDVAILACRGRLVGGPETSELDRCVRDLQEMRQRYVVVDVHEVPF